MKNNNPTQKVKSTYSMLVQSEEKERNLFETLVYGVIVLSAVVAIWQVAHQPVKVPFTDQAQAPAAQAAVVSHS
jgi:multidrug resistance efflux pump